MNTTTHTRTLALALALLTASFAGAPAAHAQQTTGPHWPVHDLDRGENQHSIVLRLQFDDPQTVTLASATRVPGRAHGRRTEPPQLRLRLLDAAGGLLEQFNAWHPLWAFKFEGGQERRVIASSGTGRFVMPYSPNLARIEVRDVPADQELIAVGLADLAINSLATAGVPPDVIVGQPFDVTLHAHVTNHGPATPMDIRLTTTAAPPAGVQVDPAPSPADALGVAAGELRSLTQTFSVTCEAPGAHTVSFAAAVSPLNGSDADLNPSNDQATTQVTVDCVVPVAINIRPGGLPNSIDLHDTTVSVAVLTTAAGEYGLPLAFDATTIAPSSVRFGPEGPVFQGLGGGTERHRRLHISDEPELDERTRDGDLDVALHFSAVESALFAGQTTACVKGLFTDSASGAQFTFFGCDSTNIVP